MKKETIIPTVLLCALTLIGCICVWNKNKTNNEDAIKFKEEYEKLNGTIRESDGAKYNDINISKKNPIQYISALEAVDIIKNKTGIIYFGANWCPWCRNAIPVLFEAAEDMNLKTVYYVDMDKTRNVWQVVDGKLEKSQIEGKGYYELLESLDSILGENYTLKDENGKSYDTKEKRIYMPMVIAVKNGKIVKQHVGTVELDEEQTKYSVLTKEQHKELLKTYQALIRSMKTDGSCTDDEKCS